METVLVDRAAEMEAVRAGLRRAAEGKGGLLLLRGEAGIGKTRLLEEAVAEARRSGFEAGLGAALPEAADLYHPWDEALRSLGLDHLLREEAPPRLLALYILGGGAVPAGAAERPGLTADPEIFAAMSNAVADFLREGLAHIAGPAGGNLLRFSHGSRGICILRAGSFALVAVLDGRENELFLRDMARLADEVDRHAGSVLREWDGRPVEGLGAMLRAVLDSGKYEGVDLAADGQSRKYNLFDNVLFGLRRRSAHRPLLVVLDDLQWADPSSLGLLHYLARNTRGDRILLVCAYRADEMGVRPHLQDTLRGMRREDIGGEIPVSPLSAGDMRALAGNLLGRSELPQGFLDILAGETGGNPLFVREVIMALREDGALAADPATGGVRLVRRVEHLHVPSKIRDAVERRLGHLSAEERAILDAAAVCGMHFDGALVAGVMGEPEARVLRGLNGVARLHALVRSEGLAWRFEHPVVREVLYAALSEDLKRLYHRSAAGVLEGRGGGPDAVGRHYTAARDARAVPPLSTAASGAMARGAPDEAAGFLRSALDVAPAGGRAGLLEALAGALELAGRYDEALDALAEAEKAGAPAARCAGRRAAVLDSLTRWAEAERVAAEGLRGTPPGEAAHLMARLAAVKMRQGRFGEALADAEEALRLYPPEEKAGRGNVLNTIGSCYMSQEKHDLALDSYARAIRLREEAGDRRGVANSLNNIGVVHSMRGELDMALEHFRMSLAGNEAVGDRRAVAYNLINIGDLLVMRGDAASALEHCRRSMAVCEAIADRYGAAASLEGIGTALSRSGDASGAVKMLDRSIALCREIGEKNLRAIALARSVPPRIAAGRLESARECAVESLRLAREAGPGPEEGYAARAMGEVEAAAGNIEEAWRHFADSAAHFESLTPPEAADTHRSWGLAAKAAGLADEAREHLEKSAALFGACKLDRRVAEVTSSIPPHP